MAYKQSAPGKGLRRKKQIIIYRTSTYVPGLIIFALNIKYPVITVEGH